MNAAAKIPDYARLPVPDIGKLHFGPQISPRFPEELNAWDNAREKWKQEQSSKQVKRQRCNGSAGSKSRRTGQLEQVPGQQKGEQRKGRQGVMKKLGVDQSENEKNGNNSSDEVIIDSIAPPPKLPNKCW